MNPSIARLALLKWNRFHTVAVLVLGIGWALDSFEVTLINNVLGVLKSQWNLSANATSAILSVWFIGLMIGAASFGYLADRFGRRRIFLASLLLYGSFTFLTAFAPNYDFLIIARFITAVGVGAEYSAINAAISEFIPSRQRGAAGAAVMNFWTIGGIAASLLALVLFAVLPPDFGWRVAFGFGALVAFSTVLLRRHLPESPRWLASHGDQEGADDIVERIAQGQVRFATRPTPAKAVKRAGILSHAGALIRFYPGRLALGCLLDFSEASGYYGLFAFLPLVVLPLLKLPAGQLPWFYLIGNVGALAGGIAVSLLLDRLGRKSTVMMFYGATAIGTLIFAHFIQGTSSIIIGFTLVNLLATGSWISAYPTFSELFPTELRASGIGLSVAFGRLGAAFSPFLITAAAAQFGPGGALAMLAGFWLIGFAAMLAYAMRGTEGRHQPLETLSPHRG